MSILNIASYKFFPLTHLKEWREHLLEKCQLLELKGTIILSPEGINLNLAGTIESVAEFISYLTAHHFFADMTFRESYSAERPFKRLKIKIKNEIITLRRAEIRPEVDAAPKVSPQELKQWLDEKQDLTLLDTRNDYEIAYGTFVGATNLKMRDFCEFPQVAEKLIPSKTIVLFCTGGIRCEKASVYLLNKGFRNVYQLEGGILNYFARVGGTHYEGECFVFDERVTLYPKRFNFRCSE